MAKFVNGSTYRTREIEIHQFLRGRPGGQKVFAEVTPQIKVAEQWCVYHFRNENTVDRSQQVKTTLSERVHKWRNSFGENCRVTPPKERDFHIHALLSTALVGMSLEKKKQLDDLRDAKIECRNTNRKEKCVQTARPVDHKPTRNDQADSDGECKKPLQVLSPC